MRASFTIPEWGSDRQDNTLKETNPLENIHLFKLGAAHPSHTDTVEEIQNTLREGTDIKLSGLRLRSIKQNHCKIQ